MTSIIGSDGPRAGSLLNESGGPWGGRGSGGPGAGGGGSGGSGGGSGGNGSGGGGPRNPWSQPPEGGRPRGPRPTGASALDELLRKGREGFGGNFPGGGGTKPLWLIGIALFVGLWVVFTSVHRIGPQERGVITRFGEYSGALGPGIGFSFPAPIDRVQKVDIEEIRTANIGASANEPNLVLTSDQNIIDLAYSVRWNINDPALFLFQLADPVGSVSETAETAMREVVANVPLNDAIGPARGQIESQVAMRMQQMLNQYRSGVRVQGVEIRQADPPGQVVEAFRAVSAAQQNAITYVNQARQYSRQLVARAQGEAGAFDRVYQEYRLAPEVTRRRMYYETMEQVLSRVDKTIVEADGVNSYLPLRELQRSTPQAQQGGGQ